MQEKKTDNTLMDENLFDGIFEGWELDFKEPEFNFDIDMTFDNAFDDLLSDHKAKKKKQHSYTMRLDRTKDADIIKKLEGVPSFQTYVKELIRKDITKSKEV